MRKQATVVYNCILSSEEIDSIKALAQKDKLSVNRFVNNAIVGAQTESDLTRPFRLGFAYGCIYLALNAGKATNDRSDEYKSIIENPASLNEAIVSLEGRSRWKEEMSYVKTFLVASDYDDKPFDEMDRLEFARGYYVGRRVGTYFSEK